MCSSPKTNLAAATPKVPFHRFMASMTLAQRQHFAQVANRADDRRQIREDRLKGQHNMPEAKPVNVTGHNNNSFINKLIHFCQQHLVV
jgi:hypothetical protein|tara:strand:- start:17111 stop:17374 length:264 start_codon:yes stop_codon:yes gene_type:complete